jgi:hypothetical protein
MRSHTVAVSPPENTQGTETSEVKPKSRSSSQVEETLDEMASKKGIWNQEGPWTLSVEVLETDNCGNRTMKSYCTLSLSQKKIMSDELRGNGRFVWNWNATMSFSDAGVQLHFIMYEKKMISDGKVQYFLFFFFFFFFF